MLGSSKGYFLKIYNLKIFLQMKVEILSKEKTEYLIQGLRTLGKIEDPENAKKTA